MAQKLLVEELGSRYVRDFFLNAYFVVGDRLHKLTTVDDERRLVHTKSFGLSDAIPRFANDSVPIETLKDFTTFRFPKLGYRQFMTGRLGNIVVQFGSMRATSRGLKDEYMEAKMLPVYRALDNDMLGGYGDVTAARRAKEVFNPTFTQFSVGIKQLLAGESLGFAVNEDLAVGVSCDTSADRGFDVYFRGRVVGNVDEKGHLTIVNKILRRESLKKKLFS